MWVVIQFRSQYENSNIYQEKFSNDWRSNRQNNIVEIAEAIMNARIISH